MELVSRIIVLASSSPRRSDLLNAHGVPFEIVLPEAEELSDCSISPVELVERNAQIKARDVSSRMPDRIVVGADTVVAFGGRVFGKPSSWEEAEEMLGILDGQTHEVLSGVCIHHAGTAREVLFTESTKVTFHSRTAEDRRSYLKRIHPLDKAGSYSAQCDDGFMIKEIRGLVSNVVGLPVEKLLPKLTDFTNQFAISGF
jgi:septum formation protein